MGAAYARAMIASTASAIVGSWGAHIGPVRPLAPLLLLKLVAQGKLWPEKFVTHHFKLGQMMEANDTFGKAAETKAMKVAIAR
jgi:alcohol dehydrogenase